jgi:hypothetical protein
LQPNLRRIKRANDRPRIGGVRILGVKLRRAREIAGRQITGRGTHAQIELSREIHGAIEFELFVAAYQENLVRTHAAVRDVKGRRSRTVTSFCRELGIARSTERQQFWALV